MQDNDHSAPRENQTEAIKFSELGTTPRLGPDEIANLEITEILCRLKGCVSLMKATAPLIQQKCHEAFQRMAADALRSSDSQDEVLETMLSTGIKLRDVIIESHQEAKIFGDMFELSGQFLTACNKRLGEFKSLSMIQKDSFSEVYSCLKLIDDCVFSSNLGNCLVELDQIVTFLDHASYQLEFHRREFKERDNKDSDETAQHPKLFPFGKTGMKQDVIVLVVELQTHADTGKCKMQIARDLYPDLGEKRIKSLLGSISRYLGNGKVVLPSTEYFKSKRKSS